MSEAVLSRIKNAENLPSLPNVAIEVLRLTRSDDVKVDELAKVVQNDPALSAKILKVVNSPLFGLAREVGSIKQAMVILGLRTVKVMALSFSLVDALKVTESGDFDLEKYWQRSITTAVAARLFAKHIAPRQAEEAFVAGLLSDMGQFVLWRCLPDEFGGAMLLSKAKNLPFFEAESRTFGANHAAIGSSLLSQWTLPEAVCQSIAAHHGDGMDAVSEANRPMAQSVYAAAQIAEVFSQDVPLSQLTQIKERVLSQTGIEADVLESLLENLSQHVKSTANLLNLKIGQAMSYAQLQVDASIQLAKITMEAEMDRAAASRQVEAVTAEVSRLSEEKKAILEVAATDGLTKIANRASFDKRLQEEIERAAQLQQPLGLILLDVDHFKKFNDAHGHRAGDEVLKNVARCLNETASKAGLVARYGGEEFAVIAVNAASAQLRTLAEEIRKSIETSTVEHEGKQLRVTASLGAATFQPGKQRVVPAEAIERADKRLYAAKHAGRNRVEIAI